MQGQASGGGQSNGDGLLAVVLVGMAALILLQHTQAGGLISQWVGFKRLQLALIAPFNAEARAVADWAARYPNQVWQAGQAWRLADFVGQFWRWPVVAGLMALAGWTYVQAPRSRFRRRFDMQGLLAEQALHFPAVAPVLGRNLLKEPLNEGPWAAPQSPIELAIRAGLLRDGQGQVLTQAVQSPDTRFDRARATELLVRQLGPRRPAHPRELPPYQRALFALCAGRYVPDQVVPRTDLAGRLLAALGRKGQRKIPGGKARADALAAHLSRHFKEGRHGAAHQMDFGETDTLLELAWAQPEVQARWQAHAYSYTALMDLLSLARNKGVLTTADFLWLKPVNRTLWYALNSLGAPWAPLDKCAHAEAAGPFAHALAERALGMAIPDPQVDSGVDALEDALREEGWLPDQPAGKS